VLSNNNLKVMKMKITSDEQPTTNTRKINILR
jgi:hypothetical protein